MPDKKTIEKAMKDKAQGKTRRSEESAYKKGQRRTAAMKKRRK